MIFSCLQFRPGNRGAHIKFNQMQHRPFPPLAVFLGFVLIAVGWPALADTVTLKDGSVIHGKNLHIANGTVIITTGFAGDLSIKQDLVASFETDKATYVRTKTAPAVLGKVQPKGAGLIIASSRGVTPLTVDSIKSSWLPGDKDPELAHWSLDLSTDISGKSGSASGFAGDGGIVATRKTASDTLKLYGSADHTVANGLTSADMYKGGLEYNTFFSPVYSWFASGELIQDNVQSIHLRASSLAGFGWNPIRNPHEDLQFRIGLSYRYDIYNTTPPTPNFSSPGGNLALVHRLDITPWFVLHNSLGYMPSFRDTNNYIIDHDSNLTMPLAGLHAWSLRVGMTNEYTSKPVDNDKHLETIYYLRFVYTVR